MALARALEDAGVAHGRPAADAIPVLEEAFDIYERIGAARDGDRVLAALRDRGIRDRRYSRRQRATVGWSSLTDTELKVVEPAAQGLTNPQGERLFVSRRTVETHLRHVFQKLGLTSRTQLAARGHLAGGIDQNQGEVVPCSNLTDAVRAPSNRLRLTVEKGGGVTLEKCQSIANPRSRKRSEQPG